MTREEYGIAFEKGFHLTARFLVSRGISYDTSLETAQAAWAKGWDKIGQLRDPKMVFTWVNSIALNIYRSRLRSVPVEGELPELSVMPKGSNYVIDAERILNKCTPSDQIVLTMHYIEGYKVSEIAQELGFTETAVRIRLLRARRSAAKKSTQKNIPRIKDEEMPRAKDGKPSIVEIVAQHWRATGGDNTQLLGFIRQQHPNAADSSATSAKNFLVYQRGWSKEGVPPSGAPPTPQPVKAASQVAAPKPSTNEVRLAPILQVMNGQVPGKLSEFFGELAHNAQALADLMKRLEEKPAQMAMLLAAIQIQSGQK